MSPTMIKHISNVCIYLIISLSLQGCGGNTPTMPSETSLVESTTFGSETPPIITEIEPEAMDIDTVPTLMSPPSGTEEIAGIHQGSASPYTGVVLNEAGAAWLETEPEAVQERCQLFVTRRTGDLRARLLAETSRLQLRINTLVQINAIEIGARDSRIADLLATNEELRNRGGEWWEQALIAIGVFIVGAALGLIIGFVAR